MFWVLRWLYYLDLSYLHLISGFNWYMYNTEVTVFTFMYLNRQNLQTRKMQVNKRTMTLVPNSSNKDNFEDNTYNL